jgi:long-chain fatty acid transport protein
MSVGFRWLVGLLLVACCLPAPAGAQGLIMPGAGAVNRSMAGASTAVALDAAGASYWNPAAISALPRNEVYFGSEMIYADTNLSSTVPAGTIGGIFPPDTRSGRTNSNSGLATLPTIAMVYHPDHSKMTFGLGLFSLAGGGVNFPGSATNPVLSPNNPPPPFTADKSLGVGPIYSSALAFQIAPLMSMQLTDHLAVGVGPTIDVMTMSVDPAFFAPRDDANGDGASKFPAATHGRPFWGGGYQVGMLYAFSENFGVGFSYKSPQWFETLKWNSADEIGAARELRLGFRLPYILSLGFGYSGIPRTTLALDIRYFDYAGAAPFGGPLADGGLLWQSIFSVATGVRYRCSDRCSLQAGYLFNDNPIPDPATLFNIQLPGINKHALSLGGSLQLTRSISMNLAAVYAFRNSISGAILEVPGTSVALDQDVTSIVAGFGVTFP